jgi:hypothetical protein
MEQSGVDARVETLLLELHEKKRWLDTMIDGLEAALASPEHQLIALAEEIFEGDAAAAPRVDLQREGRAALTVLARSVGATPQARRKRSRAGGQAAST